MTNNNLRDKGYPNSREYKYNPTPIANALMTNNVPIEVGNEPSEFTQTNKSLIGTRDALNFLVKAYQSLTANKSDAPQIDMVDNAGDDAVSYGLKFQSPESGAKGFLVNSVSETKPDSYSGAINGLNSVLGNNSFRMPVVTSVGRGNLGYTGGVLYGDFKPSVDDYYVRAFKQMMNRGTL